MIKRSLTLILVALACSASWSTAQTPPAVRNPKNPPVFQRFAAPPSGLLRFLVSDQGRRFLRRVRTPAAVAMLKGLGEDLTQVSSAGAPPEEVPVQRQDVSVSATARIAPSLSEPQVLQNPQTPIVNGCGLDGTVFNLEPAKDAGPQTNESLDFFYSGVAAGADLVVEGAFDFSAGGTGYYAHTAVGGCSPQFQGLLPDLVGLSGETDSGFGNPVVTIDQPHGVVYMADMHSGSGASGGTTAIGLFRTSRPNLLNAGLCPAGIHTTAQAKTCWPLGKLIDPLPDSMNQYQQDAPATAADPRTSGIGSSNVYVTGTEFNFKSNTSRIWLVACTLQLVCSAPVIVSGSDTGAQFSTVGVRPDGRISVTYLEATSKSIAVDIKYLACLPQGAPVNPSCAPPVVVRHETQPINGALIAESFPVFTFPRHADRLDGAINQAFVVWDRCKVAPTPEFCPDADIQMSFTTNDGATWTAPINVDANSGDQFFPAITTDVGRKAINIVFYDNHSDVKFHHRYLIDLVQIPSGSTTPAAPLAVTSTPNDASSNLLLFGLGPQYLGVAARGPGGIGSNRIYTGYSYNLRQGNYMGALAPQPDNYVSRLTY